MDKEAWHFKVWKQFNRKVFHKTLTAADQAGKKFFLDKVQAVGKENRVEELPVDKKVFKFAKEGQDYLLEEDFASKLPLNPTDSIDCYLKESDKTIFKLVTKGVSAKLTPQRTMTFREFVDGWNPMEHTDMMSKKFLTMLLVASKHKSIKCSICSEAESGKNMNFTLGGFITNDIVKLGMPITLARLYESLFFNKVIIGNEITSLSGAQVKDVERVFIDLADGSPDMEKHSMARKKNMSKIGIEKTSVIFPFNRVQDLSAGAVFFDDVWQNKAAIKSRYPSFLLKGRVTTVMREPNASESNEIMEKNYQEMRVWAKNFIYYIEGGINQEMHHWSEESKKKLILNSSRHTVNTEGILDCVNVYCLTVEEYNEWIDWLNQCIIDYRKMTHPQDAGTLGNYMTEEIIQ